MIWPRVLQCLCARSVFKSTVTSFDPGVCPNVLLTFSSLFGEFLRLLIFRDVFTKSVRFHVFFQSIVS